ncbi:MAG: hypothetical protein ACHP7P_13565, partial [Terriglobales bacterium]
AGGQIAKGGGPAIMCGMKTLTTLTALIARIGTNPDFIAANAHCWFAFAIVTVVMPHWALVPAVAVPAAAIKEFWFDANYEVPHQTFMDNLEDFGGYMLGILLGIGANAWLR